VASSINDRVEAIMEGERFSLAKPTQSHVEDYNIAAAEFAQQLRRLRTLVEVDLAKLEKDMEAAGAPWTPGRVPEWRRNRGSGHGFAFRIRRKAGSFHRKDAESAETPQ
jgi:hypothetical protein